MCSSKKTPKVEKEAAPEPVKRRDEEAAQVRSDAQRRAAAAFGTLGTDLTKNQVSEKKKTMGGE